MDNKAMSAQLITAFDGKEVIDHCPGIYISSVWMNSLHALSFAIDCGFSLGEYSKALWCVAESITTLKSVRKKLEVRDAS